MVLMEIDWVIILNILLKHNSRVIYSFLISVNLSGSATILEGIDANHHNKSSN